MLGASEEFAASLSVSGEGNLGVWFAEHEIGESGIASVATGDFSVGLLRGGAASSTEGSDEGHVSAVFKGSAPRLSTPRTMMLTV